MVIYTDAPEVKEIGLAAFPDYSGRKFKLEPFPSTGMSLHSYWSGGSRNYFAFAHLDTRKATESVPQNGTVFDGENYKVTHLPENVALVEHSYFCGKDLGLTIYVGEENLVKMIPASVELTVDEKIVLAATRAYKASYGGVSNVRFKEARGATGITLIRWDEAKASCVAKRLLDKRGAITNEGKNAIGNIRLESLIKELYSTYK